MIDTIKSIEPQIGNQDSVCKTDAPIVHIMLFELVSLCILTALPGAEAAINVHMVDIASKNRKFLFHFLL